MPLPHFIFDFGVVLFRWRPLVLLAQVLPERVPDEAAARHWAAQIFQGYGGDWALFDQGLVEVDELAGRISARTGLSVAEALAVIQAVPDELEPLPGTVAVIEQLRAAGHRLFFLSNMPAPYADALQARYPLSDWFEDGVFSSRVKLIKPDPAIFHAALAQFGVLASDCVFIDDHPANVQAARELGWGAILFTHPDDVALQVIQHLED